MNNRMVQMFSGTVAKVPKLLTRAVPAVDRIPIKMIKDVPLPMPYSVMRSPSHIASMLPATSITPTKMHPTTLLPNTLVIAPALFQLMTIPSA